MKNKHGLLNTFWLLVASLLLISSCNTSSPQTLSAKSENIATVAVPTVLPAPTPITISNFYPTKIHLPDGTVLNLEYGNGSDSPEDSDQLVRLWNWIYTKEKVISLSAHNHLAGRNFYQLRSGDIVTLEYPNQITYSYQLKEIIDLPYSNPEEYEYYYKGGTITIHQMIDLFHRQENKLAPYEKIVFQTCLPRHNSGLRTWTGYKINTLNQ